MEAATSFEALEHIYQATDNSNRVTKDFFRGF
jgi:hypothetical protein